MLLKQLLLVGFGGFAGSIARFMCFKLNVYFKFAAFPAVTLAVNIAGSFIIGLTAGYLLKNNALHNDLKLLVAAGFCGGFTTFSTFADENLFLLQNGHVLSALLYISASVVFSIIAVYLGYLITSP
jgi:CrcB protein